MGKRMSWSVVALAAALALVSGSPVQAAEIVYLPSWQGSVSQIQWGIVDYVMYAFAIPNADGSVGAIENGAKLTQACQAAHANGKRCLLSFGGWNNGNDSGFEALAGNATARTNFANACLNLINQYGLDGVDFDWEYPEADDSGRYGQMIDAVRARIGTGKLITAAVANHGSNGQAVKDNLGKMNFVMAMSYDGDGGAGHAPYNYAVQAMDFWGGNKVFLGVPFYARPSWAGYSTLLGAGCSASSDTCVYQGVTNYYNGQPTIRAKRDLCAQRGCMGLMAWEVTFDVADSRSLQQAMNGGGSVTPTPRPRATATPTTPPRVTPTPRPGTTPRPTARPTARPTSGGGTWAPNTFYSVGANVTYGGASYRCIQAHTSLVGWEPPNVPALWQRL
jgi:chitinase